MVTKIAEPEVRFTERVNIAITPDMRGWLQRVAASQQTAEATVARQALAAWLTKFPEQRLPA